MLAASNAAIAKIQAYQRFVHEKLMLAERQIHTLIPLLGAHGINVDGIAGAYVTGSHATSFQVEEGNSLCVPLNATSKRTWKRQESAEKFVQQVVSEVQAAGIRLELNQFSFVHREDRVQEKDLSPGERTVNVTLSV